MVIPTNNITGSSPITQPNTITRVPQPAPNPVNASSPGTIQTPTNPNTTPNGIPSTEIESDISNGVANGSRHLNGPEAEQRYDQLSNALPQLGTNNSSPNQGSNANQLMVNGNQAFEQGNFAAATSSFRQALQQPGLSDEQRSGLQFNLARSLERQGNTQEAADEYGRFLETAPPGTDGTAIQQAQHFISQTQSNTVHSLVQGADNDFQQGNYAAAETGFRQALEQTQPGTQQHASIQYNIARCCEQQGHTQQAAQEYGQFLNVAPTHTDSAALQHARQVSGKQTPPPSVQQSLTNGTTAYGQGNYAEATEQFRNALGRIPETHAEQRSSVQFNLARSLEAQGRTLDASLEYRRFLENAPPAADPQAIQQAQQFIAQTQQVPF